MRLALAMVCVLAALGCGKKDAAKTDDNGSAGHHHGATGSGEGAGTPAPGPGITVAHSVPEFSGTYDKVFGKLANADEPTTLAFVRGCPAIACTDNVFEIESIAAKCPKAYLALATIPGQDPKPGHRHSDLAFAGPAEKPATATLEHVKLEITDIGPDGIAGSAIQKTTESSVSGAFKAEICGRM
ncbi:MAG TPA: hypothetical protein VFQ65_24635 [Kofleriaceae bacterium]|nr:hypothetical protein [Kofleriaceae bacterium]